ncbi:hypothetical protein RB653_010108 [Dictyostelium firmibasis]|uniref:P2X receptor n=1 Tax=Dictyostelium firmibasis TaxID=79012 RepID=A0AAN7TKK0_9MYCE
MGLNFDWDDIFQYSTVKVVRIRDRRLGILHLLFLVGIVAYIVIYSAIVKKGYLFTEVPIGSVRTSLKAPNTFASNLTYCLNQNSTEKYQWTPLECNYWDEQLALFPVGQDSTFTCTTRVRLSKQKADCDFTSPNCKFVDVPGTAQNIYIADIESFTILIDHTMYASSSGSQFNAVDLHGYILNQDGDEVQINENGTSVGVQGKPDIITLGQLLSFGGVSLDQSSPVDSNVSIRYDGVVLFVFITYSNTYTYSTSDFRYVYSVQQIENTIYDVPETIILESIDSRLLYKRHGVRVIFIQTGTIGSFHFQTLLLTLVSGLGLLAVATTVVDQMAIRLLPQRKSYSSLKFQVTESMSNPMKKRITTDEGEDVLYTRIEGL